MQKIFTRPHFYILIAIIGIGLKFYKLDSRLFWEDEMSTVLHTSGVDLKVINQLLPSNEIRHKSFYDSIIHLNTQHLTIWGQLKGLAGETQLTPGHYSFLIFWHRLAGDSNLAFRLFSVLIFILTLPLLFFLCKILFQSNLAGWMAVALYAVSPFIHIYSQEARYYILWSFFFILTNLLFLLTVRDYKRLWLVMYFLAAVFSLYVSVLSGLFLAGHFIYMMLYKKDLRRKFYIPYVVLLLLYLPWIYSLYHNHNEIVSALEWHKNLSPDTNPLFTLFWQLTGWTKPFVMFSNNTIYRNLFTEPITPDMYFPLFMDGCVVVLLIYAFYFLYRNTDKNISLFLCLVFIPQILFFFVSDVVRDSNISRFWKYHTISMVCVQLILVNLLYRKILDRKPVYYFILSLLIVSGIFSIFLRSQNRCWYARNDCNPNFEDAMTISSARRPLVITDLDTGMSDFLVILNQCEKQDIDVLFLPDPAQMKTPSSLAAYSDIFVIQASDKLTDHIRLIYGDKLTIVHEKQPPALQAMWKIKVGN